ncbi:tRNA glutamyl-Q(34) synthetase GluQRS [Stenotrophomonas sp. YIM B06876]|uniref:tRNA glutamyl-Q(34) synthetase GluQRS n=1 Tax=Stenotrophomonas sp. YIM B06876 TaxID=3060211 RepID=UPI00273A59E5|nr:tRNA glutamyl-Q(34) synthetase GluQRS [Stenotrophomonas sp. YIM B06876]
MPDLPYRGRFAPSPTGPLHLGSMLVAFGSWLLARHANGQWLLRIEDLDPPREVPGAADCQRATLAAFGLHPDAPPQYQSARHHRYRQALERLLDLGLAFECHCSRAELDAQGGIHRHCVARTRRRQPAIRLRVPDSRPVGFDDGLQGHVEQDVRSAVGDFVLRRADGCWAYQLAVVVDDAEQQINHVVRGADLVDSTPRQLLLQRALGLPSPHYLHLPLLLDAEGRKLSKSLAAAPVNAGAPLPVLRWLWTTLGQPAEALGTCRDVAALLEAAHCHFDPARLPRQSLRVETGAPTAAQPH